MAQQSDEFVQELAGLMDDCDPASSPYESIWEAVDEIILDPSFENNACLMGVYETLGGSEKWNEYLKRFDADNSVAHLRLQGAVLADTIAAQTFTPSDYQIKIKFNTSGLNIPTLDVAATFIHEMIHAEMDRKLLSLAKKGDLSIDNLTQQEQTAYVEAIQNNYPGIYDYYRRHKDWEHEQMVSHYRIIIEEVLNQYITNTSPTYDDVSSSTIEAIAWIGLQGTIAWNNLNDSIQNDIIDSYFDFRTSYSNCQQ